MAKLRLDLSDTTRTVPAVLDQIAAKLAVDAKDLSVRIAADGAMTLLVAGVVRGTVSITLAQQEKWAHICGVIDSPTVASGSLSLLATV